MKLKNLLIIILCIVIIILTFIIIKKQFSQIRFYDAKGNKIENLTILSGIELDKSLENNSKPLEDCYYQVNNVNDTEIEYWEKMCGCLGEGLCLNYTYFQIDKNTFTKTWAEVSCQKIKKNVFDCQGQKVKI